MRTNTNEIRDTVILGHRLEVQLSEDGHWHVSVDGEEILARFANAYAAWAVGAAESYRQGRAQGAPFVHD